MRISTKLHRSSSVVLLALMVVGGCRSGNQHRHQSPPTSAPQSYAPTMSPDSAPSAPSVPPPYDEDFPQLINPNQGGNPVIVPEPEGASRSRRFGPLGFLNQGTSTSSRSSMPNLSESPRFAGRKLRKSHRGNTASFSQAQEPVLANAAVYPPVSMPEPELAMPEQSRGETLYGHTPITPTEEATQPFEPANTQPFEPANTQPLPAPQNVALAPASSEPLPWSSSPAVQNSSVRGPAIATLPVTERSEAQPAPVPMPLNSIPAEAPQPALLPGPSLFAPAPVVDEAEPEFIRPGPSEGYGSYFPSQNLPGMNSSKASLSEIAVCSAVRGVKDFDSLNAKRLAPGQEILVYAALENFRCEKTSAGFRTYTYSSVEIRLPDGRPIVREPLGTAVDIAREPRQVQFLTHQIRLPGQLSTGEYTLHITVLDLNSQQRTEMEMPIEIR